MSDFRDLAERMQTIAVLSKNEEKRLREALRRTFLDGYPNPERRGCPGSDILKAIASGKLTLEEAEPWINHLSACSPCTREFADLRKNFQMWRMLRLSAIAAAVLVVVGVAAWLFLRHPAGPVRIQAVTLDLTNQLILRGAEEHPPNPPLQLPRGNLNLTVYLPVGSEPGTYEVQVLREPGQPVWSAQAEVKLENFKATLRASADFSNLQSGLYLLAIRQKGLSWTYSPLVLK
jgi:hypothetical protein